MALVSLDSLPSELLESRVEALASVVREFNPTIHVRTGVIRSLVLELAARFAEARRIESAEILRSSDLLAVTTALAQGLSIDEEIVLNVLSNFGVTPTPLAAAGGEIEIRVRTLNSLTIPAGFIFTSRSQSFVVTQAYTARTNPANVLSPSDRLLTPDGQGNFRFNIPVVAVVAGSTGNIPQGSSLTPLSAISNFVSAAAVEDFTGGISSESIQQLLGRVREGVAAKSISDRTSMTAWLRNQAQFAQFSASSIIGYGDPEMRRGFAGPFPVALPGRVDWYLRTRELPVQSLVVAQGVLVEKTADERGIWQIALDRDDMAGVYSVVGVSLSQDTGLATPSQILSETRNYDRSPALGAFTPDVTSSAQAAFSAFQTATLTVKDDVINTTTLVVGTSEQEFLVNVRRMPDIAAIQQVAGGRSHRSMHGDVMIKAPVPAHLAVSVVLEARPRQLLPDPDTIKLAIARVVNQSGFGGRIYASQLASVIYPLLGSAASQVVVRSIDMEMQLVRPDGSVLVDRSGQVLTVPDEPGKMVTARTTCFFLDPANVTVSSVSVAIPDTL